MGLLDQVLERAGWPKLRADLARRRRNGELVGAGIAMYVEKSGLGPSDGVKMAVDTSGRVEGVTGGASGGQGFETGMAPVAAGTNGVDYRHGRLVPRQPRPNPLRLGGPPARATGGNG